MKSVAISKIRLACISLMIVCATGAAVHAQTGGKLQIGSLDRLAPKAVESVEVNIDERLLRLGGKFLSAKKPDEVKVKELITGIKGIYVKSFEFDAEGAYSGADVEEIRTQLKAPGWARIIDVRSRRKREGGNIEVYLLTEGERVGGLAVISFDPKRLTVINIVGPVDLDKLSRLEGQFGIPELELERDRQPKEK